MKTLKQYTIEQMKDPEFVREYNKLQPDMAIKRSIIDARLSKRMTQRELSEKTGIAQGEISK